MVNASTALLVPKLRLIGACLGGGIGYDGPTACRKYVSTFFNLDATETSCQISIEFQELQSHVSTSMNVSCNPEVSNFSLTRRHLRL